MHVAAMFQRRAVLAGAWALLLITGVPSTAVSAVARAPDAAAAEPSAAVHSMLQWVRQKSDNAGAPFAIIDKANAHLWLFDAGGRAMGHTPVLLGLARGDDSVPGIGERALKDIRPHERTTPAGRFVVERGRNLSGEDIFWVDYDAAVSLHRVRATKASEQRLQRLATPTAADNRISYGCINVPAAFYDKAIDPLFSAPRPVVYLLPEGPPAAHPAVQSGRAAVRR